MKSSGLCSGPLMLDFDGDGVADSAFLMSVEGPVGVAPNVTVVRGLWGADVKGARRATLFIKFGKSNRAFLLTDMSGFFDTPIWRQKPLPLEAAKRGSKAYSEFHVQEKRIQNDILVLGTEAGIDTALYWNGKTFVLFAPAEEP
jgi:hypothetical protein